MFLFGVANWLSIWLTPIWMLGVGAAIGLLALLVLWILLLVVNRRAAITASSMLWEGPTLPIFVVALLLTVFGVAGWFLASDRQEILSSLQRLPFVGTQELQVSLPASTDEASDPTVVDVGSAFRGDEFRSITINANADLILTIPGDEEQPDIRWPITGGEEFSKQRGIDISFETYGQQAIQLKAQNVGDRDTVASVQLATSPKHPQVNAVAITAISVFGFFALYWLLNWLFPKASAIALATAKSEMTQPQFFLLIGLGIFLLLLFLFIPYHTFGEDIKVLKDSGLTLIMVFAIFSAVWAASNSISEEIEGRTAITVLSKPISRRQFILGKFLGISWSTAVMFVLLGVWLLIIVSYKPIYDARETANTSPTWQACQVEMARTVPGLVLAFFETLVFAAIGVAISTRLPLLANLVICFAIYAFGHLTPLLMQSGADQFENVKFMAQFIATLLPVLDQFNIAPAIASGIAVPLSYMGMAAVYCFLYCAVMLLLALALFEDRDVG